MIEAAKLFGKSISNEVLDVNEATTLNEPSKQMNDGINAIETCVDPLKEEDKREENRTKIDDTKALNRQNEISLIFDIAEFMIVKHLPFNSASDILEFAQKISQKYSPELINYSHTSSTTITQVVKACIGDTLKSKIYKKLEESPFSILLDASSDLYGDNYLTILVRYFENPFYPPVTKFIAAIEIGASSIGEVLYEKVKEEIFGSEFNVTTNLIAICTDGGSNMISSKGAGLTNKLQDTISSLVHVSDVCHAYNRIAEEATKHFPKYIIDFLKDVCSFITRSVQRKMKFKELQIMKRKVNPSFNPNEVEEVPVFKEIRWLSLCKVANYVSFHWNDLKEFYQAQDTDIKDNFTPDYQLYIDLLALLLKKLHYYTQHFQNGTFLMNHVISQLKISYSEFVAYILKSPYDRPEKEANYFEIVYPLSLEVGSHSLKSIIEFKDFFFTKFESFKIEIEKLVLTKPNFEFEFLKVAKDFITTTVSQMKERLLFKNEIIMQSLISYWPSICEKNTWSSLAKKFPYIITNVSDFESELDRFCACYGYLRPSQEKPPASKITETWAAQEFEFPLITKLARVLLVLPYTSAEVESTFSKFKVFKSP